MRHTSFHSIIVVASTALVLAMAPASLTAARTPATDTCVAGLSTPSAGMSQAGMMAGTPPMGHGDITGMMGQFDLMFIDMMIPHHASAVAMAQVATSRAEHPEIRSLAEQIVRSQSAEIEQMRSWRDQWYPDAPPMPMMSMEQMMAIVEAMPGGMMGTPAAMPGMDAMGMMSMEQELARLCAAAQHFDLAFIDAMIPHHRSAIMMAQVALARAQHPELRSLAQAIVDAQQREIEQMQAWRAAWSGMATPAS
jgi:uncharacterized protein (DUF305 family)